MQAPDVAAGAQTPGMEDGLGFGVATEAPPVPYDLGQYGVVDGTAVDFHLKPDHSILILPPNFDI